MGWKRRRGGDGGMEENMLAILDTYCFSKSTQHIADDRQSFLEAVRSGFLVTENASAPSHKMYKAIFQILNVEKSLDLILSSYQLLLQLDKRFPQAWSPFSFVTDVTSSEKEDNGKNSESVDVSDFHLLIEDLCEVPTETDTEILNLEFLRKMLLFQYLIHILEGDFVHRNLKFAENSDWVALRESLLNSIVVSRKIPYKGLVKDCISTMCALSQFSTDCRLDMTSTESKSTDVTEKYHTAVALALPETVTRTCAAVQKLLLMIIELDSSKKAADQEGLTTRADGTRTPAVEIIFDELTYDKNILFPFFQALDKPKLKLDLIVQYLGKYIPKTPARTRRSNGSTSDSTFGGVLTYFSNGINTKGIIKRISSEVAQMLLAHAFQAYILLPSQYSTESTEGTPDNSLPNICNDMISAFTCLKKADKDAGILPFGKEALFTAAIMVSRN